HLKHLRRDIRILSTLAYYMDQVIAINVLRKTCDLDAKEIDDAYEKVLESIVKSYKKGIEVFNKYIVALDSKESAEKKPDISKESLEFKEALMELYGLEDIPEEYYDIKPHGEPVVRDSPPSTIVRDDPSTVVRD